MGTEAANDALSRFCGLTPAIRGAAVLHGGDLVVASGDDGRWLDAATSLLAAADAAACDRASHAHVATEAGEVYAVRSGELAMVAVTDRFALASLMLADMRATLRSIRNVTANTVRTAA